MKVALVQPPVWWTIDPPLGLAQVAGALKAAGHDTAVFDFNIELWHRRPPEYENLWLWEQSHFWHDPAVIDRFFGDNKGLIEKEVEDLLESDAGIVAFSVNVGSRLAALKLAGMIKEADPSRKVVFGGQDFFIGDKAREVLAHAAVDAVVRDAGEDVFPALVADFERTGRLSCRPGTVVRDGAAIADGGRAPFKRLLDDMPFADLTGFPMDLYSDAERLPIAASRGCVWACRFCSTREFWDTYSYMSGDRIFAEVLHQHRLFPSRGHFEFYDITANGRPETLGRFSDLMIDARMSRRPLSHRVESWPYWKINAIIRPEMTRDLLRRMAAAGCVSIIYGVESGSPRVLRRMNKHFDPQTASRVLRATHEAGIKTTANFMFGFPGETEEDFQQTLAFVERNAAWLDCAYASATFTSLEEHSYLTDHQAEFDIRPAPEERFHNLYWESRDGSNTYLVRLDRYRRFRQKCIELGIDAYKGVNGSLDLEITRSLADYHRSRGNTAEAIDAYSRYLREDPANSIVRAELERLREKEAVTA
jgi:anaerobic magnesium-protoporphyrin IX monomethyl ester cyclase